MRDESGRRKAAVEWTSVHANHATTCRQHRSRGLKSTLRSAFRFPPFMAACALLALIGGPAATPRAAPTSTPAKIRVVALSPDEISRLPDDWQPMRRTEYEALLRKARPATGRPSGAVASHVTYEATFAGDSLTAGRLSAVVRRPRREDVWLDLGNVNLAISELRQGGREIPWGTTAAGRVLARVTDDVQPLTGAWTLAGERNGQRRRFEVNLIPATASLLKLTLPRGYRLEASAGVVSGPITEVGDRRSEVGDRRSEVGQGNTSGTAPTSDLRPPTSGAAQWRVVLSSATSTLLTVVPPEPSAAEKPVVLVDSELAYVIRDTGLQIQLRIIPEVLGGSVDSLAFRLPSDVEVFSAYYGFDTPLEFTSRKSGGSQLLRVRFPDPLQGRGRAITVQGVAPVRRNRPWELPRFETAAALFLQGRVHLRVERPLEFQSLSTTGLRQTTGVLQSPNGETLSFDRRRPDARLQLTVGLPTTRTNCRAVTHLEVVGEQWRATTELTWTATRGPLYAVHCRVPGRMRRGGPIQDRAAAGWQIGAVQLVGVPTSVGIGPTEVGTPTDRAVSWTQQRVERGLRKMSFDLPGGLAAGESVTLRIAATRPVRSRRRRVQWPAVAPEGVDRLESVVVMAPGLLPSQPAAFPAGFRTLTPAELPEFARNSKVWQTAAGLGDGKLVILHHVGWAVPTRRNRMVGTAHPTPLVLGKPDPALDARSWTWVESSAGTVRERFHITVLPRNEPVDAVLVYVSRKGPDLDWTLSVKDARPEPLRATRLPESRLAAWKLPADGELWKIKLPRPTTKPFELRAARSRAAGREPSVGLPFLPQARRFVGHVEARPFVVTGFSRSKDRLKPVTTNIPADANGDLFPIDATPQRPAGKDVPPLTKSARLWRYRTAQATLTLRDSAAAEVVSPPSPVDVELWSVLSGAAGGFDAHRIVFRLPPSPRISEFASRWDSAAKISTVLLNGRRVDAVRRDDLRIIQSLPAATSNTLEFRYTLPSASVGWSTLREVVVPRCRQSVGNFRWHFALPPHVRLNAGPAALAVRPVAPRRILPGPRPDWSTRLFGPLARAPESPVFNPLSDRTWRQLFELADGVPLADAAASGTQPPGNGWSPAGWSVHTAAGIDVPAAVTLRLTNRDRSRLWSWIGLLFCLVAGWIVRRAEFARRRQLGAVWLSVCLAAALFVPGEFAEFAGACLAGSLIVTVLSRKVIRREAADDKTASDVPLGSTLSYPRVISTTLLLAALGLAASGASQAFQPGSEVGDRAKAEGGRTLTTHHSPLTSATLDSDAVVVPAAADDKKPGETPIVFVHRKLLASLKDAAERALPPRYVLQRAEYRVSVVAEQSADVTAAYDVVLFDPDRTVSVLLPIQDAALIGADACRVNGRVQPVRRDPAGRGFLVDVALPQRKRKAKGGRSVDFSPRESRNGLSARAFAWTEVHATPCRIELRLQSRIETVQRDDRLRIRIPRVVSGRLALHLPFDSRPFVVPGLTAATAERFWFSQSLTGRLAPAGMLEVHWGDGASLASRRSKLTADVQGLADVGVANVRVRYHVRYEVESGSVSSVVWNVPAAWVLRKVALPDTPSRRPAFRRLTSSVNGQSRMRIDLPAAQTKPFALEAEFLVPLRRPLPPAKRKRKAEGGKRNPENKKRTVAIPASAFRLRLPRLHSESPSGSTIPPVEETSNRFAIASSAEIAISVTPVNQAAVRAIDKALLAEFRRQFPGGRQPDHGYELQQPTALDVAITPHAPRRTVRQTQQGRFAGDGLQWTFSADVTVDGAPAYGHELLVDPRLAVESVRVLEDGAPRLVRWTRSGNRVHLFLSDKTAATQKVVLEARMPVRLGALLRLPNVRFSDAVAEPSQIQLSRDSRIGVEVADRGDWEQLATEQRRKAEGGRPERSHDICTFRLPPSAFRLPPSAFPRLPRVRPALRRATLQARRLTVLKRSKQGGLTAECTLEFQDALPPSEYSVFLPRAVAGAVSPDRGSWQRISERPIDAGVLRRLRPIAANGKVPLLTFRLSVTAADSRRWELPLPAPHAAELRQDILAIVPDGERVVVTSAAEKVRPAALPAWMKSRLDDADAVLYRGRGPVWQLGAGSAESQPDDLKVPFLETCVWLGGDNVESGCTQAFVAAPGQSRVAFRWPAGLSLRSVRLNGRPVVWTAEGGGRRSSPLTNLNSQSEGRLIVPLDSGPLNVVRIDWERPSAPGLGILGRSQVAFPSPVSKTASTALVTIIPSRRQSLFRLAGVDTLDAVAYALQRIERLLDVALRQPSPNAAALDESAAVHQSRAAARIAVEAAARAHRSLLRFLKSPRANGQPLDDETRQRLDRIDAVVKRARQRFPQPGANRSVEMFDDSMLFATADPNGDAVIRGELQAAYDAPRVRFWHADRRLIAALLAALALLIAVPVARRLFRAEIGERLAAWEPVSWIILGTVWWLLLVPSVVGLVLFSVAVAKLVRRWHKRRTAGNIIRLYDLSQSREAKKS